MIDRARLFTADRPRRPNVMARDHVVVSGHYWASLAGLQVLEAGGNAVDAGVATGLAIDVLESQYVGFGGVAPIMLYLAERNEVVVVSGVGPWPAAAHAEYFHTHHDGRIPDGILHTVVPAASANWIAALERYGTMSFGEVAAAAIRFARDGFPTYPFLAEIIAAKQNEIQQWPDTAAIFLPGGRVPDVGTPFVQADLAATLQYMVDEERSSEGRRAGLRAAHDAFYRGDIAAAIAQHQRANGGWLTADDLAAFQARFEPPCRGTFRGTDIFACGPWSQGPMLLEALNIIEPLDLRAMGHNSAEYIHAVVEALKIAAADREAWFGDPDFEDVPLKILLSEPYTATRRALFDPRRAWPMMPPAGDAGRPARPWHPDPSAAGHAGSARPATSFLCIADRHGNIFAATPSDGTIGGPVVPGTGILPSMWGSRGYTAPDHPARIGPGRRPRMSANPAIAIRPGEWIMPFGSPGSEVLGQAMVQAFLNMTVFGMDPQSAVEAPRVASYSWPESALPHSYRPGRLNVEADIGEDVIVTLAALGHVIERWPARKYLAGSVCTILSDQPSGVKWAGADPRRTAYAIGW
ncbi:MAG TPA: gamma-glutamyltransferase [Acetobacteraceae bacterium]